MERLLHRVQLAVRGESFDRRHLMTVGLDSEHVAGLDAPAVQVDGAGAAVAGVTSHHRPGLPQSLPQVVNEKHACLDVVGVLRTVDVQVD